MVVEADEAYFDDLADVFALWLLKLMKLMMML